MQHESTVTVSIVSHGHGHMLNSLVSSLLSFEQVESIVLTMNIPEVFSEILDERILIIQNQTPKGFAANHNAAFQQSRSEYFCVLNPDVVVKENPFPLLLGDLIANSQIGLIAPLVKDLQGGVEDSARPFLTVKNLVRRNLMSQTDAYPLEEGGPIFFPAWIAGMFMLYPSTIYESIKGFDEKYFLYVEDADICTRIWRAGYKVGIDPRISIIHDARRASLKSWQHFSWHIQGILRYLCKFAYRLPKTPRYDE